MTLGQYHRGAVAFSFWLWRLHNAPIVGYPRYNDVCQSFHIVGALTALTTTPLNSRSDANFFSLPRGKFQKILCISLKKFQFDVPDINSNACKPLQTDQKKKRFIYENIIFNITRINFCVSFLIDYTLPELEDEVCICKLSISVREQLRKIDRE